MAKNNYAKVLRQAQKVTSTRYAEIRSQIDCDAALIAANEVLQLGPGRAKAFAEAMINAANEIALMFVEDGKDDATLEYSKVTLDRRIKEIVGEENFQPWDERYGRIYDRKR